jgi:HK97 gp10 family phage protein
MAKAKLTTFGFDEYMKLLEKTNKNLTPAATRANLAGAEVAKKGMRERVPKDEHDLENHIVIGEPVIGANEVTVEVGVLKPDAEIARYGTAQEFGTSSMPASPYVRPTMKKDAKKIRAAQVESLKKDGIL